MSRVLLAAVCVMVLSAAVSVKAGDPSIPLPYETWKGGRVLMIGAHPDDIEACSGGLISLLSAANIEVGYLIITNGDKGCGADFCANYTSPDLAVMRAQEAVNAAAVLGVSAANVILLNYEDGMVTSYPEQQLRADIVGVIRSFKPLVVMSWYPLPRMELRPSEGWMDLGYHPDHQATGALTLSAQFTAGVARMFPLSGAAWHVLEYYQWEFLEPTHYVDLSAATAQGNALDAKINSWLAHKTQYPTPALVTAELTLLAQRMATRINIANLTLAEGFRAYW